MMLVGPQPIGTWLLVFLDTAREVLSEQKARQIADALEAMRLAMQGDSQVDHLFADLVGREPQLPEFLKS
jgi:hydrogenase expression/formation protein HypC